MISNSELYIQQCEENLIEGRALAKKGDIIIKEYTKDRIPYQEIETILEIQNGWTEKEQTILSDLTK